MITKKVSKFSNINSVNAIDMHLLIFIEMLKEFKVIDEPSDTSKFYVYARRIHINLATEEWNFRLATNR